MTLLDFIKGAVKATAKRNARRHLYILTCYFDIETLVEVISEISKRLESVSGKVAGVTVAIDVGEWIRCRVSSSKLKEQISKAANIEKKRVKVVPVRAPGQLLHAKAYAAIRPHDQQKGFVVITSGNTTRPGLGLSIPGNLEIAALITEPESLVVFTHIMQELEEYKISGKNAMKQDDFLRALALFKSGQFYHRWQGSLGAEIRFTLTLTRKGKSARKSNAKEFGGYQFDGHTMSRSPIDIEQVFIDNPKPFNAPFWRNYAVDTLLGYWVPGPVACIVDEKLKEDASPYIKGVEQLLTPQRINRVAGRLKIDINNFRKRKWIEEECSIVDSWETRVNDFRKRTDLIQLRIFPYQKVPDVFTIETRQAITETAKFLREHLSSKKIMSPTKGVVAKFFSNPGMTVEELDKEWERVGKCARKIL
ncbi:MAG: phospholipase D-like domain-containing protein [Gammaproteobacteria bacterium]